MSDDKLPTGRWSRLIRGAAIGARTGFDLLQQTNSDAAARKAAATLGQLRGLAAKVGQMASYVDGIVPPEKAAQYEKWMKGLRNQAPRSSWSSVEQVLREQLGSDYARYFQHIETEPIASASIGQVHRATLSDGSMVAVKVQHPGISEAMEHDLKSAGLIEGTLARMAGMRKFNSKAILEEMRQRFREELDYALEARHQKRFGVLFEGVDRIHVPQVYDHLSTQRVLTTEWVGGRDFDLACDASESLRRAWAEALWEFVYRSNLLGAIFNADPHPGNYKFHDDGRVSFLDFGCIQPIDKRKIGWARRMHWSARRRDKEGFEDATRRLLDLRGGRYEPRALDYIHECFRPLSESPFHVTRTYVVGLVNKMKAMIVDFRKGSGDGYIPLPDGLFFVNRLQFGFYSVLARLDVEVNYASVEAGFLTDEMIAQGAELG